VVKVCEAVKLYLDAPGLIFVIACDQSVLAKGVSLSARGDARDGRAYLEKIVQVAYRMRPPEEQQIKNLIHACARQSGTAELFDETVTSILAEGTGRNPRRIKRVINSFVLEYRLDPAWREPGLGTAQLITAVLLQHLYTSFYDLLASKESGVNPIDEFLDYLEVREKTPEIPAADDPVWEIFGRLLKEHGLQPPEKFPIEGEKLTAVLEGLGKKLGDFPTLADNDAFIRLLRSVKKEGAVEALRAQLLRSPLSTIPATEPPGFQPDPNNPLFIVGQPSAYTPIVTGTPPPTVSLSQGQLPRGLSMNPSTGVISGTPVPGTVGTYAITLTARNGVGQDATLSLALTVIPEAPETASVTLA
jgi:Putative Ig domain/KAP family P-loop domain